MTVCMRGALWELQPAGGHIMMDDGAGLMMAGTGLPMNRGGGLRIITGGGILTTPMDGCGSPDMTGLPRGLNGAMGVIVSDGRR